MEHAPLCSYLTSDWTYLWLLWWQEETRTTFWSTEKDGLGWMSIIVGNVWTCLFSWSFPCWSPVLHETLLRLYKGNIWQSKSLIQFHFFFCTDKPFIVLLLIFPFCIVKESGNISQCIVPGLLRAALGFFYLSLYQVASNLFISESVITSESFYEKSFIIRVFLIGLWAKISLYK